MYIPFFYKSYIHPYGKIHAIESILSTIMQLFSAWSMHLSMRKY